jgi:hypothetical protein
MNILQLMHDFIYVMMGDLFALLAGAGSRGALE